MSDSVRILAERLERLCEDLEEHARLDEQRMQEIREDLKVIRHVVTDGNGSPSLTVQVARNSERIEAIEPQLVKVVKAADDGRFDKKSKASILVALLAFGAAIGVPVMQYVLG